MRFHRVGLISLVIISSCTPPPAAGPTGGATTATIGVPFDWPFRGRDPVASGSNGAVVTAESRATRVGLDILQAGGNAVDAAVAVGFALAVVYPQAGNIGGGGFMVIRKADGETAAIDYREAAPLGITPERYLDFEGRVSSDIVIGHLAAGVPGAVAGMYEAHRGHGSLPWADVVAPAIDLAENGFTVTETLHDDLANKAETLTRFESTALTFFPGGSPPRIGTPFRQPDLARTLQLIAREGKDGFYRGRMADLIVQEIQRGGGVMLLEDLARYRAVWREPITFQYRDHTIISMPPPSSGGVTLAEILNILEGYSLRPLGYGTAESIHLFVEAARRAFADRNYYLGDPDYVDMPVTRLISDEYAAEQRASISRARASSSEFFNRVPIAGEGSNTTHISVVDAEGTAVSVTTTVNSFFGSGVVVKDAGFFLNNEMDDFTVRAGVANQFDLIQSDANLVGPGRRPLSSMTPTIVVGPDAQLRMILGSPGGPRIITAVAQVIVNVIDFGMGARAAVDAPRVHHQLLPDEILFESKGFDGRTVGTLGQMGHDVAPNEGHFGNVQLILRGSDGLLYGAADPRREDGRALAY